MVTREAAKRFVHGALPGLVNLRRTGYDAIPTPAFKAELETAVRGLLAGRAEYAALLADPALVGEILDECLGLGALEVFLREPGITEIMVNGPDEVFVERGGRLQKTEARFPSEENLRHVIARIVSPLGRRIDESSPMVDARLPDGSRFNAVLPPLSLRGPVVTIRKFCPSLLRADDFIANGSIPEEAARLLKLSVGLRQNILVSGGTGSGKTTLLNLLSSFIPAAERIVTLEDSAELRLRQPHVVALESRPPNIEGKGTVSIRDLLRNSLRMRPDRIVVGECRGEETLDMLQAMNTGHDGSMTTLHANSARDALARLETLVLLSGCSWPLPAVRQQIASAVDLIVHLVRERDGTRRVAQIIELCGTDQGSILTQDIFASRPAEGAAWTGLVPRFFDAATPEERRRWSAAIFGKTA